jgi:serine/threonine-protein kinase RsbW
LVHWQVPAGVEYVPILRHAAVRFCRNNCSDDANVCEDVAVVVSEACTNVVRHAYPECSGMLDLEAMAADDGLVVVVSDRGVGAHVRTDDPGSGFGLQLMAAFSRLKLHSDDQGTRVEMRFHCSPASGTEAGPND